MKTTSRFALAAAAGLFVGAMAFTPAKAADLGGDCCADLEERVAELEATTVRKGNRVVSVELYGQVNKTFLVWDDGIDSDAYVVDSDVSSSRFGFRGSASISPDLSAGYRIEIQTESASSISVSQDEGNLDGFASTAAFPGDDGGGNTISVRRSSLYLESGRLGRLTMGLTSIATDDLVYTYLGSANITSGNFNGGGLRIRTTDPRLNNTTGYYGSVLDEESGDCDNIVAGTLCTIFNAGGIGAETDDVEDVAESEDPDALGDFAGTLSLNDLVTDTDIGRRDAIRYDTPSIYGFIFSAGWGESDEWDAAVRFRKEWNSIQVVAAAGYHEQDDVDKDTNIDQNRWILSGGIKHTPSGLFLNGVYVEQETEDLATAGDGVIGLGNAGGGGLDDAVDFGAIGNTEDATYYQIFGGIEKNWTGYGLTTIYGRYAGYEDFGVGTEGDFDFSCAGPNNCFVQDQDVITGSDVTQWGFGLEQNIDAAAMEIYTDFSYYEIDELQYFDAFASNATGVTTINSTNGVEDIWTWYVGSRIRF